MAGIIPALEAGFLARAGERWNTIRMRPGRYPVANMLDALDKLWGTADPGSAFPQRAQLEKHLRQERSALRRIASDVEEAGHIGGNGVGARKRLLVIDQFEKIFSRKGASQSEKEVFVRAIVDYYLEPHVAMYIIVTMRSSFIGDATKFVGLADLLNETMYLTPVLDEAELRAAICKPARDYYGSVDPTLVDEIALGVREGTRYEEDHLPLVQHALLWLWLKSWVRSGRPDIRPYEGRPASEPVLLTMKDFRDSGGLHGILERHSEEILSVAVKKFGRRGDIVAKIMFQRLTKCDDHGRYRRTPDGG